MASASANPFNMKHALWLIAAAFAIRAVQFGNPVIQVDEQFYLLVGDRMLHGGIPFVDMWDRKPIGLFAIYAAIRLLGGEGILQYQIVATLFAAVTAIVIHRIALRLSPPSGAVMAGLIYLVYLSANGGDGGQAPVFYNLPVALAAWSVIRVIERPRFDSACLQLSLLAMLLMAVAIQIKYSTIFEGAFFGVSLLTIFHRRIGSFPRLVGFALLMIGVALSTTALATFLYWRGGHLHAFLFTNFQSVFLRPTVTGGELRGRLVKMAVHTAPVALVALWAMTRRYEAVAVAGFVKLWAGVALAALLGFGTYYDHYALPLLVPFTILGASIYTRRRGLWVGVVVVVIGIVIAAQTIRQNRLNRSGGSATYAAAVAIRPALHGCIFVFSGDPALYHLTRSCFPTAYNFPTLLSERRDALTLGVDQMAELRRTMDTNPQFVLTRSPPPLEAAPDAWRYMASVLQQRYVLVRRDRAGNRDQLLYARR